MLGDPLAQGIVIVGRETEDKNVNEVDLLFDIPCVIINDLPPESKCNQQSYQSDPRKNKEDMCEHLAGHRAYTVLHIVKVVNALKKAMGPDHIQRAESEVEGRIFFLEPFPVFLVFLIVDIS